MAHSQPLKLQLRLAFLLRRHTGTSQNTPFRDKSASQLPGIWHDWITLFICFDPKAAFAKTVSSLPLSPAPSCFSRRQSVCHLRRCMSARVAFVPLGSPVGRGSRGTERPVAPGAAALRAASTALPSCCRFPITLAEVHRSYSHPSGRKQGQAPLKWPEGVLHVSKHCKQIGTAGRNSIARVVQMEHHCCSEVITTAEQFVHLNEQKITNKQNPNQNQTKPHKF